MKCAVELNSVHDVEKFTAIVSQVDDDAWLVGSDEKVIPGICRQSRCSVPYCCRQKRKRNENAQHTMLTGIPFIASAIKTSIA